MNFIASAQTRKVSILCIHERYDGSLEIDLQTRLYFVRHLEKYYWPTLSLQWP